MARQSGKLHGLSDKTSDVILVLITAIVMFIVAYPLYYVLVASFSDPYDVYAGKTFLLPSGFTLDGYKAVFADDNIFTGYLNSVKYTVIGTIFSVVMLYITAYPLSVKSLPGRKWISLFFVFTMYFGGGLVPTYLVVKDTGLINNMWALFLPGGVAVGNMIIVRNYFQNSIPHDLIEAAEIDGCSKFRTFLSIIIPLSMPIIAVLSLWVAIALWNGYFNPLIYINSEEKYPLQLILRRILLMAQVDFGNSSVDPRVVMENQYLSQMLRYGTIIISSLPLMIIYPFVQKYFVKGVMIGAVKG